MYRTRTLNLYTRAHTLGRVKKTNWVWRYIKAATTCKPHQYTILLTSQFHNCRRTLYWISESSSIFVLFPCCPESTLNSLCRIQVLVSNVFSKKNSYSKVFIFCNWSFFFDQTNLWVSSLSNTNSYPRAIIYCIENDSKRMQTTS